MLLYRLLLVFIFGFYLSFLYAQQGWQLQVESASDFSSSVMVAPNNNYVVASHNGIYTVDSEGNLLNNYDKDFGVSSIAVMDDGNYVFQTRFFNGDSLRIVKINPSGEKIWEQSNIPWYVNLYFLFRTQDDHIIQVSSDFNSSGGSDSWVAKFTTSGSLLWEKPISEAPVYTFEIKGGIETQSNELLFRGYSINNYSNSYPKFVKTNDEGIAICTKIFGLPNGNGLAAMLELTDGRFLLGFTNNNLLVTDSCGNIKQSIVIPGISSILSIVPADDGGAFIAGTSNQFNGFYFGKIDQNGNAIFIKKIDINPATRVSLAKSLDGAVVIGIGGWLLKSFDFNEPFLTNVYEVVQACNSCMLSIYPNPNTKLSHVTVQSEEKLPENAILIVRNIDGQIVRIENPLWQCNGNQCWGNLQVEGLLPGVYIVEASGDAKRWIGKFAR